MRNNLYELPVLLACLWGGAAAGGLAFLLRLPKTLYLKKRRGLRVGLPLRALFFALDLLLCTVCAGVFAAVLVYANGGEIRLYAASGFGFALWAVVKLLKVLCFGRPRTR